MVSTARNRHQENVIIEVVCGRSCSHHEKPKSASFNFQRGYHRERSGSREKHAKYAFTWPQGYHGQKLHQCRRGVPHICITQKIYSNCAFYTLMEKIYFSLTFLTTVLIRDHHQQNSTAWKFSKDSRTDLQLERRAIFKTSQIIHIILIRVLVRGASSIKTLNASKYTAI